jgi:hypothetical protein
MLLGTNPHGQLLHSPFLVMVQVTRFSCLFFGHFGMTGAEFLCVPVTSITRFRDLDPVTCRAGAVPWERGAKQLLQLNLGFVFSAIRSYWRPNIAAPLKHSINM